MTVRAYCELGESGGARKKYLIRLDEYRPNDVSNDNVQVSITGKLLRYSGARFREWSGIIRVTDSPESGYGSISELRALHNTQAELDFLAPEVAADDVAEVLWLGEFDQQPIRPPLDIMHIKFTFKETTGS